MSSDTKQNLAPATRRASPGHMVDVGLAHVTAAFDEALKVLAPGGTGRELAALFEGRCDRTAVLHWRAGRRHPPEWACRILATKLIAQGQALGALGNTLDQVERPTPDHVQNLVGWHARQRAQKEKAGD